MVMENYPAVGYENKPSTKTPINATNLNKTDIQVKYLTDAMRNVQTSLESGQMAQAIEGIQNTLNGKVDLDGLHKTYNEIEPIIHTGAVDYFGLDYGEHLIRSDTTTNAPPNTRITRAVVTKTHNEVGSGGSGAVQPPSVFEQGTISESSAVGTDYNLSKYPATEPLHGSRIRTIAPIAINEFSTISIASGFDYCVTYFDENQKYLGRSSFMSWGSENRLTYPEARYIGVAIKKSGATVEPITPAVATQAKLTVSVLGQITGGSKQIIAYGLLKGDVWECFNSAGAWGGWIQTSSALPLDANEGDILVFRSGKWVAEAPTP